MDKVTQVEWLAMGFSCRVAEFEPFKPICQIWDPAQTVYFNLEGKISVAIERRSKYTQEFLDQFQVGLINPGISFGEIGVLYDANRTASCIALTQVICLSLDQKIFQRVLGDHVRALNNVRLSYLSGLKMFQNWDRTSLSGLLTHVYLRTPKHHEYVYQEGDINKNIYIVVEGELEIIAHFELKKEIEEDKEIAYKNNKEKFEERYKKKTKSEKVEISLFSLNKGNYFGDENGYHNQTAKFSIKVTSGNTKLFLIPKDVILLIL